MFSVRKYEVSLRRNVHAAELFRKRRRFGDLDTRHVMEAARAVAHVGAHPVGGATHLSGDSIDLNREALPQRGEIIEGASGVSTCQSSNEERPALFES